MKRVFAYQPPEEEIYKVKSFLSQMDAGYKVSWTADHSRWQIEADDFKDAEGIVINLEFKPFLRCCKHDSFMEINENDMIVCPICTREEELSRMKSGCRRYFIADPTVAFLEAIDKLSISENGWDVCGVKGRCFGNQHVFCAIYPMGTNDMGITIDGTEYLFLRCGKCGTFFDKFGLDIRCPACYLEEELERSNGKKFRERLGECCSAGPENIIFHKGFPYQLCPPKEQGKLVMMTYEEISWISGMIAGIPCYLKDKLRQAM